MGRSSCSEGICAYAERAFSIKKTGTSKMITFFHDILLLKLLIGGGCIIFKERLNIVFITVAQYYSAAYLSLTVPQECLED
jgi:hypothetical protein